MLSSVRVASRTAASHQANLRTAVVGARFASAWSNVPQGPPVIAHILLTEDVGFGCNC